MKKVKVTYILSTINKALAFEWISAFINKDKFDLHFILLNPGDSELENYFKRNNVAVDRITFTGKKDIPRAILKTCRILKKQKPAVVHAHLFEASLVGLTAAWLMGIKKRIHTRHHSNYHHTYFPKAVKYDRFINRLSTDIVAISQVVKTVLTAKEQVPEKKIHLIHHGFQLNEFRNAPEAAVDQLRKKYIRRNAHPVVGVISRYMELKGIQYIIPAFEKLLATYPDALLLLANADGNYKDHIKALLQKIPQKNYMEIPFEADIFALYQLFDVFIHVPITPETEAFGQTYVEALSAGIPSIFTLSGIANEFVKHRYNAWVVPHRDSSAIYEAMITLIENEDLRKTLIVNGEKDVFFRFDLSKMILSLESIYAK